MMYPRITILLCFFFLLSLHGGAQKEDIRYRYLRDIFSINTPNDHRVSISRRISVQDSTWMDWLNRTKELPPDFSQLHSSPFLPDPLEIKRGDKVFPVRTLDDWKEKKEQIKNDYQYWVSGQIPPSPKEFKSTLLSERNEGNVKIQLIEVSFGPSFKGRMTFELIIPSGDSPKPIYMTQWNHRSWAQLAVRRGYIGCVYAASDDRDDTQMYQELYPEYDFTCLMRRAWGASRVIDYLVTRPEVDTSKIAITGHSRNGKQSLWAAAFDERISAVISSSCGTGGITPWRYSDPQYCNQTLDDITANAAHWFHPRLRFFFGREDKLPTEQNLLLSLIAPRVLLLHYSVMERQLNPWANEQCYKSVEKVYSFLSATDKIGILPRKGEHAVATRDLENCLDFLDIQFSRTELSWENKMYTYFSYDEWKSAPVRNSKGEKNIPFITLGNYKDTTAYLSDKNKILNTFDQLLGDMPPVISPTEVRQTTEGRMDWKDMITKRPVLKGAKTVLVGPYTSLGTHLSCRLYIPDTNKKDYPVIIYLHPYAYAHGYAVGYSPEIGNRGNQVLFQDLIDNGFAVLAIDMFGFGSRLEEATSLYRRFPDASKMGMILKDVEACVDWLSTLDNVDENRISILGNTLGGSVAIMAAARDSRISNVAVVAAFSPWRASNGQYESIRAFSHIHGLIPMLGKYVNEPMKVPVDYKELLSCIAPRPLMLISPELDRYADMDAVCETADEVAAIYHLFNAPECFLFKTPREINRLTDDMLKDIIAFLKKE